MPDARLIWRPAYIRLVIGPDCIDPAYIDPDAFLLDILVIIQSGGKWHGQALDETGPAMKICVTRPALQKFYDDLLAEALDPVICNEASQEFLRSR